MGRRTKSFLNGKQPIIPKACSGNTTVPLDLKPICPSGCYLKNKRPIRISAFPKKKNHNVCILNIQGRTKEGDPCYHGDNGQDIFVSSRELSFGLGNITRLHLLSFS